MNFIKNLKMATKLMGSFAILIAAMVVIGVLSTNNMSKLNAYSQDIYNKNYQATVYIMEIKSNLNFISTYTNRVINNDYAADINTNLAAITTTSTANNTLISEFDKLIGDNTELRAEFETFNRMLAEYRDIRNRVIDFAKEGKYEEATNENNEVLTPMVINLRNQIDKMIEYEKKNAEQMLLDSTEAYTGSKAFTYTIIGVMVVIAIIMGWIISSLVSGALKHACSATGMIADGDLTVMIPEEFQAQKDEIGNLARNIQAMRDGLYETVAGIKNSTDVLDKSVTSTNNTLVVLNDRISDTSAATEELSAGMEETGASAEEMHATAAEIERAVEMVAEKAEDGATKSGEIHNRASNLGENVNSSIDKSNKIFGEIKVSLEKALEDSKAVDEINALADAILGITSQTTLLALNASIEAARAGEAGRGFAVVANEISALADNSKNTVTQIQAITKVVMSAVNALANSSTNLLNFVSDDVMKDYKSMLEAADSYNNDAIFISDMTSDLSATSEELLASVQVMMRAISEVSAAAQEGAKTTTIVAEQTTDISMNAQTIVENMKDTENTAHQLTNLVNKFKV